MSQGQLHTTQWVHQHAIAFLHQCWLCCSKAEHYKSSSCICSISIPERVNVIVLGRMAAIDTYLTTPIRLKVRNLGHKTPLAPDSFFAQVSAYLE